MTSPPTPPPAVPRWRTLWSGWPGRVARAALGAAPIVWLVRHVQPGAVRTGALHIGARGLLMALAVQYLGLVIAAARWRVILRAYGAAPSRIPSTLTLLRDVMVGQYFAVLPTGLIGDAVRAHRVAALFTAAGTPYALIFVERIAGLVGLLVLGAAASLVPGASLHPAVARALALGFAAAATLATVGFVLPQFAHRRPRIAAWMARVPLLGAIVARIPVASDAGALAFAVALSVPTQVCAVLAIAALIVPVDPHATLAVCARVVPAIVLVTHVPLTPGGVGQREIAFVEFFRAAGVAPGNALAASLMVFAIVLVLALLGGAVLLIERLAARRR